MSHELLGTIWQLKEMYMKNKCSKHNRYYRKILRLNESSQRTDVPYKIPKTDKVE